MRANRRWCAGVLAAAGMTAGLGVVTAKAGLDTPAQHAPGPSTVAPKDRNAAIRYLSVFAQLPRSGAVADVDWDAVGANLDPAKMPAAYKDAVKVVDPAIVAQIRAAASLVKCDFEHRYEDGWAMLLPELGNFRQCIRLLRVDAREAMMAGDMERAADNLVAGYRMVRHVSRDPIMICSLVGSAMAEFIHKETQLFMNAPGATRERKQHIADAIRALGDDPLNIRAAIEGERAMSLGWMRRKIMDSEDSGRAAMLEAIGVAAGVASDSPEYVLLMNLGRDELIAFIDLAEPMYRDIAAAWDAPDALDRLKNIEERVTSGGYGIFAQLFGPAFLKVHRSTSLTELHLRQLVADLEARPHTASPSPAAATGAESRGPK